MKQANFIGQRQGEKVLFTFRRHIISIRRGIYGFMIATVVFSLPFLCFPEKTALLWLVLIGLFIGLVYLFYTWIGWYFTCYIVTNERIRELRQKGLFNKTVIDLNLDKEVRTVKYINSKKTFIINGKCFNRFPKNKRIPIVLFEPSDMQLVYGSPLRRRNFFDRFIAQLDYEHQIDLNKFDRINRQRNKLIREYASKDELFAWNIQLSTLSEKITSRRSNFLDKIKKDFTNKYTKIANKPDIATVEFLPNTKKNASSILKYLDKTNDIIGAGRDDFLFTLNSLEAKSNASRGENRTIMFALLSSIVDNIRSSNNEAYILLDDIDSELDKSRRDNLYNLDSFKKNLIATTIRYNGKACKQIKLTD